jgi:Ca2+-binding RTX toxin-like protein
MSGTTTTLDQLVIIDESTQPKSIVSQYDGPLLVIAGSGGLNFQAGASTVGGAIFVQGGNNTIAGGPTVANRTTANGGLQGDWLVKTGGGENSVWLAGGDAVALLGGNDTIHAASANALIRGTGHGTSLDVFVGPGNITVSGGATRADLIQANGLPTGKDLLVGGSGGNNTITAGSGNTTLVGAGRDNLLEAAGTNVIHPGAGNDTVSFSIANTETLKPDDLIVGWHRSDTLELSGYDPTKQSWSQSTAGSVLTLSDGTQITFTHIVPSRVNIVNSSST